MLLVPRCSSCMLSVVWAFPLEWTLHRSITYGYRSFRNFAPNFHILDNWYSASLVGLLGALLNLNSNIRLRGNQEKKKRLTTYNDTEIIIPSVSIKPIHQIQQCMLGLNHFTVTWLHSRQHRTKNQPKASENLLNLDQKYILIFLGPLSLNQTYNVYEGIWSSRGYLRVIYLPRHH